MSALFLIPWFRAETITLELGQWQLELHAFQITTGIALVVVLAVAALFASKQQRSVERTLDLAVHILLLAFPVSYLLNGLLFEPETFFDILRNPEQAFDRRLGWTSLGGVVGGIFGAWIWKWRRNGSILEDGDPIAFGMPFGWSIARVGCFIVHDHPGRVSSFALAVADYQVGAPPFEPRHDLGLYEAILLASIAAVFLVVSRKPQQPGFYLGLLALLYAPCRFFLDFLRAPVAVGGDVRYAGLTPSQYISIALVAIGIAVMKYGRKGFVETTAPRLPRR